MSLTLVLGGVRSGKSERAEALAIAAGGPVRYVATADDADPSMAARVEAHVARRPSNWTTSVARDDLLGAGPEQTVLVDGLGGWIAGVMARAGAFDADGTVFALIRERVLGQLDRLADAECDVIVVAEQAGDGLLPSDSGSRRWLDLLGESTQRLARRAVHVELVVAGRPITLTQPPGSPAERWHGDQAVLPGDADHAVNVLAGGPPDWMRDALEAALTTGIERYPDERRACEALAALHGRDPEEVVPTNGATEALWLLPAALRPRLAACIGPAFGEAEAALRAHGVPVVGVQRDPAAGFAIDPARVPAAADLVIAGNPGSPCGTLHPSHTLLALRRPGRVVVVDEAFMDMVPGEAGSLIRDQLPDVIVVRSLTKSLALPGLRVGYAVAPVDIAQRLRDARPAWSCNALALAALEAAAKRPQAFADAADRARADRDDLAERLAQLPALRQWPSATNYVLVEVPDGHAALAELRRSRIAVRSAATFSGLGANHLRLTARDAAANERLAGALADALATQPAAG